MANKKIYPVLAILGIAAASGSAWWYQSKPSLPHEMTGAANAASPTSAGTPPRAAGVEIAKVEQISLRDDAQSVGSLRSRQSVMMRPEVPGRVIELGFSDGGRVRKGQVLVQLDDTLQRAEVKQAQAQVSIAQSNFKRNQELVAQNFVAQRVLDESAANLQVVEAQLALSCARLSRMQILAPFDGTVGIRNVNPGDFVKDGADLVNLEDTSSMFVDFRLPERYQGKLKPQQMVEIALDAFPGRAFKAKVEAIDPLLDVNGRSVGVRAILPNTLGEVARPEGRPAGAAEGATVPKEPRPAVKAPALSAANTSAQSEIKRTVPAVDTAGCPPAVLSASKSGVMAPLGVERAMSKVGPAPLRPGMFARVMTVFSVNDKALVVPEEAIVPQGGRQFVVKVVDPSAVPASAAAQLAPETRFVSQRQEVKLGVRRQGKVEVLDGLTEGQTVVVAGQQRLQKDGTPLKIVELGRPPQAAASASAGAASVPGTAASAPATSVAGVAPGAALRR